MRLIIVDGLDGVGKDTHSQIIANKYRKKGENVVIRSHPESDNFFGRKAKKALLGHGKINRLKASVFYMMDVLCSIRKYYRRKDIDTLIMNRYLVGTAYLPKKLAKVAYNFFENFVPTSRYMFFLDAPSSDLLKRIKTRKEREMFEKRSEFEKVRRKALTLVKNWNIIDASGSVKETFSQIEILLNKLD